MRLLFAPSSVTVDAFVGYCTTNPVLGSWLAHYDDPDDCSDSPPTAASSTSSSTSAVTVAAAVAAPAAVSSLEELQPLVQRCSKQEATNAGLFPPAPLTPATPAAAGVGGDATTAVSEDSRPQWLRAADALAAASALPAAAADDDEEGAGGDAPVAGKLPLVTAPDAQLKLQWVYGIGSEGSSAGGAAYSAKGSIVYR
jgi:hypothetical protein